MKKDKKIKPKEKNVQVVEGSALIEIPQQQSLAPVAVNPYDKIMELAITSDVGMDKLERILALRKEHEDNEDRKAYYFSMAEFKKNSVKIIKDKKEHNSSYATLANILDVVIPSLGSFGLSLSWDLEQDAKETTVTAVLTHARGYSKRVPLTFGLDTSGNKSDIHGLGSTISYLERYTAKAILGVAEKDQDNDAKGVGKKPEVNNLVKLSPEYKALQETKKLFPDEYEATIQAGGGEPLTADQCKLANESIQLLVDQKNNTEGVK